MKYLITEPQLDRIIFGYLDIQDFILIEKNNSIYFIQSEGDEFAKIRYNISDGECLIRTNLVDELSIFFSLYRANSESSIGRWVEHTLQMKVKNTKRMVAGYDWLLIIPKK
jgi:hypothetical protein